MARSSGGGAGAVVAGLTAAAFGAVAFLAFQASAAEDRPDRSRKPAAGASAKPKPSAEKQQLTLPARSGNGERVVYALERKRVWLVGANGKVQRTYRVWPSTVSPEPGQYRVSSRASHVTGSDGVAVENVVRFTAVGGTSIGFGSAVDGSRPEIDEDERTGGVRGKRADGEALWLFAVINTKVVVTP